MLEILSNKTFEIQFGKLLFYIFNNLGRIFSERDKITILMSWQILYFFGGQWSNYILKWTTYLFICVM